MKEEGEFHDVRSISSFGSLPGRCTIPSGRRELFEIVSSGQYVELPDAVFGVADSEINQHKDGAALLQML